MSANSSSLVINGNTITVNNIMDQDLLSRVGTVITGVNPSTFQASSEKGQPNGYAALDADGLVPVTQLPDITITDTFVVPTKPDLTTLVDAKVGDVGIVSTTADAGSYILATDPYSTLANWQPLITPGAVVSVNGLPGPNPVLGANNLTTGTLAAARLPTLSATGDATGTSLVGTGSIPLTLANTTVTPGLYQNMTGIVDSKGRLTGAQQGTNVSEILYQDASSVSPGSTIIRRIGNADESSYLEMSGGCDIITPGNNMNVQCAQLNFDVVGSTARVTTDDTLTLEGRNMAVNITDTTTISTPNLFVTGISGATASDVLYYDSGSGGVTYGAPPSGVTSVNGLTGPAVVLGAGNITTGTLPAAQLPALSATGDATGTGTAGTGTIPLTLANTAVTPGSYTSADITVDSKGRLTAASSGGGGAPTVKNQFYGLLNTLTDPSVATFATPVVAQSLGSITLPASTIGAATNKSIQCEVSGVISAAAAALFQSDVGVNGVNIGQIGFFNFPSAGNYPFTATIRFVPNTTAYYATLTIQTSTFATVIHNGSFYFGATGIPIDVQPIFTMTPSNPGNQIYDIQYRIELLS